MKYCYIRVSTDKQDYDRQRFILKERGFEENDSCVYIEETYTGTKNKRPLFDELLNNINEGDTLIVESLTRLSRSGVIRTLDLITELVQNKKINVYVLKENFYLNAGEKPDANTNLLLGIFSVLAQFERDLISERTKAGLKARTEKGVKLGRPRTKTSKIKLIQTIRYMVENKIGQDKAAFYCEYPTNSLKRDLKKCYERYNTKDYKKILEKLEKDKEFNL